ncbi:MAG: Rpn family recombination-promoting nuclease/putative transposase [Deltaproteobacteria bacterium]|nr:Rpn family recombination-promoting nuclease/putative transposase [Deltaproteobacteria bacterium]
MTATPHDALFKYAFSEPRRAAEVLRCVLPQSVVAAVEWDTLELQPGSYVDAALAQRHSDLVFAARLRDGKAARILVLFEHQSEPDDVMPLRLLAYQVRIWERHLVHTKGTRKVPLIIPVVLSHDPRGWHAPTRFTEVVDVTPTMLNALRDQVPDFTFILDDLSAVSDEDLRARAMSALAKLVLLSFKHARGEDDDFAALYGQWVDVVRGVWAQDGREAFGAVVRYALRVSERTTHEALTRQVAGLLGAEAKEVIMTEGERLIEQGRQRGLQQGLNQGLQQGLNQGLQQGLNQGLRRAVLRVLTSRFGALPEHARQRIEAAGEAELDRWTERVAGATRLEDVFAD